ncbi:phosphoribosylaminoimidazolesuccinocarboxamide synthase [Candidatus Bathyarchaeota archaeon]|nr:phosphoribosylaminoimidazolesuccinocarboxamide synthase [Candidatus Bathyarchaeota archaeon]
MSFDVMMESNRPLPLFRRGKVRDLYDMGKFLLIVSTDRISAFDFVLPNGIPSKGWALNMLSVYWFEKTKNIFPNHFIEKVDDRSMKVLKAERIDVEWVARSYLYGSAWRAYAQGRRVISGVELPDGLQLAEELPEIILTPTTKSDTGHDVELSKVEALERGLVSEDEWRILEEATYRLYDFYRDEASRHGLIIPDFKIEYGRVDGDLIQIDEPPTHDSARLWSKKHYRTGEKQEAHSLDKEFLRDFLMRIGYTGEGPPPSLPPLLVEEVSKRCVGSYKVLTGQATVDELHLMSVEEVLAKLTRP